jgi:hypothetical protein
VTVPALDALAALRGHPTPGRTLGVTWIPAGVLLAVFQGRTDSHARALGSFVAQAGLDLAFVPAEEPWAADAVASVNAQDALSLWAISGPLGRVERSLGWTQALRATAAAPAELAFALDEALHEALDELRAGAKAGAGAIVVADDLAGDSGPLLAPDYVLEVLLPLYRRLAALAADLGLPAVFHSDGDIRALLPALARAGFSAVHPGGVRDEALEAYRAAAEESGLVVLAGMAASRLLAGARASADAAVDFARAGRVIITDDGGISSPEEIAAFVSAVRAVRAAEGQVGT